MHIHVHVVVALRLCFKVLSSNQVGARLDAGRRWTKEAFLEKFAQLQVKANLEN